MAGKDLKDLIAAFQRNDAALHHNAIERLAQEEDGKKHTALAAELRRLSGRFTATARPIPEDRDTHLPLLRVTTPDRPWGQVVLGADAHTAVTGILDEVGHGAKLDEAGLRRWNRALLYGPPGCGKTSAVAALATALDWPLVTIKVSSLIASYLGQTGANLAAVFDFITAGQYVVLFDEFDTLGASREDSSEQNGEMRRVVSTLLQLIEEHTGPSLIAAATNFEGTLDSALWRRFDTIIEFPLPTFDELVTLIRFHVGPDLPEEIVVLSALDLAGFPHAAAEHFGLRARRAALFAGRTVVEPDDITDALLATKNRRWQ